MAASRFVCHIMGIVALVLAVVLVLIGLILEIIYQDKNKEGFSTIKIVSIILFVVGTVFCFITVIYVCCVAKKDWKLFGCCRIKTKYGDKSKIRREENITESQRDSGVMGSHKPVPFIPPPHPESSRTVNMDPNPSKNPPSVKDLGEVEEGGLTADEMALH